MEVTEDAKVMRHVTQKFLDALYDNPASLEHSDLIHQITDALKFEYGRVIFGKVLCADPRAAGVSDPSPLSLLFPFCFASAYCSSFSSFFPPLPLESIYL